MSPAQGMERAERPFAFLAHNYSPRMLDLRARILEIGREAGRLIWAAKLPDAPEDVVDICLEEVRQADHFLCLLSGEYGGTADELGRWKFLEGVSVLELELFQAAIIKKPVRLFLLSPGTCDPRLRTLLDALKMVRPDMVLEPVSESTVLSEVRRLAAPSFLPRRFFPGALLELGSRFREALAVIRSPFVSESHKATADVRFLDGFTAPLTSRFEFDPGAVRRLLAQARESARTRNYPYALSRLWSAIRWLYSVPASDSGNADAIPLWHETLVDWAALSAWQGLHGHVVLGRLAAVNTLIDLRALARRAGILEVIPYSIHASRGGAASEYFSLSKLMFSSAARRRCLTAAKSLVERAIAESEAPESHLRAVYGSIALESGDVRSGIEQLTLVLRVREEGGATVSEVGEARSELGYAVYMSGERDRGLALMALAAEELSKDQSRWAFLARALEKQGLCMLRAGHVFGARETWRRAFDIIDSMGLTGQTLDIKRRLARLFSTGRWRV